MLPPPRETQLRVPWGACDGVAVASVVVATVVVAGVIVAGVVVASVGVASVVVASVVVANVVVADVVVAGVVVASVVVAIVSLWLESLWLVTSVWLVPDKPIDMRSVLLLGKDVVTCVPWYISTLMCLSLQRCSMAHHADVKNTRCECVCVCV